MEAKSDFDEEELGVFLEDFEDDFPLPTDRDNSLFLKDVASSTATNNSNPQVSLQASSGELTLTFRLNGETNK